ncbi:Chloroplast sensor kinase [Hibiscus syriacus]|uniref:Chloroplast sensor kinase n=1 Tax=Hibiscus syriacus TaxID=106335 RepID=A0A6A3CNJ7_HIBSY|nr:Chloroplast sensor kinase [Hibiscus syriacus]
MLLSAITPQLHLSPPNSSTNQTLIRAPLLPNPCTSAPPPSATSPPPPSPTTMNPNPPSSPPPPPPPSQPPSAEPPPLPSTSLTESRKRPPQPRINHAYPRLPAPMPRTTRPLSPNRRPRRRSLRLRLPAAEAALSGQQMEVVGEHRAVVFPMGKQPFVVGFLVAELPEMDKVLQGTESEDMVHFPTPQEAYALSSPSPGPVAYVMDQKAILLQQSTWQNNVRMGALVEQVNCVSCCRIIRTLSKMLSTHFKENEISHDIVEDILVQGNRIKDTLQELQDAVHLTKANIMFYNEESLKKMRSRYANATTSSCSITRGRDQEVLQYLVDVVKPLACQQQRIVELSELSQPLQVAIEEPALRQALSNLIEGALLRTQVEIVSNSAPAGGALLVIDDDGPDMHYMTQMHSLAPFGAELFSENTIEDNMTWNFVTGLTVAREILESYGCVVRVISPHTTDAALRAGGTRVELWFPSFSAVSDINNLSQDA